MTILTWHIKTQTEIIHSSHSRSGYPGRIHHQPALGTDTDGIEDKEEGISALHFQLHFLSSELLQQSMAIAKGEEYLDHFNHPGTACVANKTTKYAYRMTSADDQARSIAA